MGIKRILHDFADWASMPGLIQLINALNAYIRLAWAIIWFAMWGVFIYEFYLIIARFLDYPTSVNISLGYKSRAFPMVTICNQNPLKYSVVRGNKTYAQVNDVIEIYQRLVMNNYAPLDDNPLNVNNQYGKFGKTTYLRQALNLAINQLSDEEKRFAGYSLENFIVAWYFNNHRVDPSFFTEFIDPSYGLCYQFNANKSSNTLYTNRAGSYFGLRALALVNQRSPDGTLQYLPLTERAGLKVGVNYQNEDPAMENYGINIGVGGETMVSLELTEVNRAVEPYGKCVENDTLNYYKDYNYTLTYCFRSCLQKRNIDSCGCANPLYARPSNSSLCGLDDLECVYDLKTLQQDDSNFSVAADCGCNPSCGDTNFAIILSVGKSPPFNYAVLSDNNPAYSCSNTTIFPSTKDCIAWYQRNSAVINLWYDGLDFSHQAEESSYSLSTASNDLGGQAGLWVGISLVSVTEILVFVIFVTIYICRGRKHTDIHLTDEIRVSERRYQVLRQLKEELDTCEIMDGEIGVRYRAFKMRDELKRLERINKGQELNRLAIEKARLKGNMKTKTL